MFIIRFERDAKNGLKSKMIMKNDNSHLQLDLKNAKIPSKVVSGPPKTLT